MDRALTRSSTVIVDSLNSIKGYRYELWCIARGMGTRYALLHVSTPLEVCQQWNAARPAQEAYSPAVMQDLGGRYERPDTRNRWDAPLITVQPQRSSMEMREALHLVRAAVDVSARESGPTRGLATKELSPTIATSTPALACEACADLTHLILLFYLMPIDVGASWAWKWSGGSFSLGHEIHVGCIN